MLFTIYRENKLQKTDHGVNLNPKAMTFLHCIEFVGASHDRFI
jgi:hypothetical protein